MTQTRNFPANVSLISAIFDVFFSGEEIFISEQGSSTKCRVEKLYSVRLNQDKTQLLVSLIDRDCKAFNLFTVLIQSSKKEKIVTFYLRNLAESFNLVYICPLGLPSDSIVKTFVFEKLK